MNYVIKRIIHYILSVIAMMAIYGTITIGASAYPDEPFQSIIFSVILFGYPFYRLIMNTVINIADYYEGEDPEKTGLLSASDFMSKYVEDSFPKLNFKNKRLAFSIDIFSKFIQFFILGSVMYAFAMNDYNTLRIAIVMVVIIFIGIMYSLFRNPVREYIKISREENDRLIERQTETGFEIDDRKLDEFMRLPTIILRVNMILMLCAIILIALNPTPKHVSVYLFLMVIKTIGGIGFFIFPVSLIYFKVEKAHSRQFTIEIGKGEYGQIKIEFYQFEGHGDNRKEIRNKIDRIERYSLSKRYISVLRAAQFKNIKIPRTFTNERQVKEIFNIMC